MEKIRPYAKAVVSLLGAIVAAVIVALQALPEGSGLGDITTLGWLIIAAAVIAQAGIVFGVPNGE